MKLFGILSWYNESPTWLAACVASMARIGVDHVIAVDGRYPHFAIGEDVCSPIEQAEMIAGVAEGCGMGLTMIRPTRSTRPLTEPEKRTLCFNLLNLIATPFEDWCVVVDADELFTKPGNGLHREILSVPDTTHTIGCLVTNTVDPFAEPAADNDVNNKTTEFHQKFVIDPAFTSYQSRFWRVLTDMHVRGTHYSYVGTDQHGVVTNMRPDIGTRMLPGMHQTDIHKLECGTTLAHRKNHRTAFRQAVKREYYEMRDELGLERVTT
jgi:hypothetical protein